MLESVKVYSGPQLVQPPVDGRHVQILRQMKEELGPLRVPHTIGPNFQSEIPDTGFIGTALRDKDALIKVAEKGLQSAYYYDLVNRGDKPELDTQVVIPCSTMFKRTNDLQTVSFDFKDLKEGKDNSCFIDQIRDGVFIGFLAEIHTNALDNQHRPGITVISSELVQQRASLHTKQKILALGKQVISEIIDSVAGESTSSVDCDRPRSPVPNIDQGIQIEVDSLSSSDLTLSLDNGSESEELELPTVILDESPDTDEVIVENPVNAPRKLTRENAFLEIPLSTGNPKSPGLNAFQVIGQKVIFERASTWIRSTRSGRVYAGGVENRDKLKTRHPKPDAGENDSKSLLHNSDTHKYGTSHSLHSA